MRNPVWENKYARSDVVGVNTCLLTAVQIPWAQP